MLVLVVDHNAETQRNLSQAISHLGHNCQAVGSAGAVHAYLQTSFPDVVLMDWLLPDCDAKRLIQSIRQNAPQARIVVMVRPGSDASIREALSWGASDFVEKPIHELRLTCLLSHLQSHLSRPQSGRSQAPCLPDVFFNNDRSAYQLARSRFHKALDMHIPLLIEGEPGTGKVTLARHLSNSIAPSQTLLQWDATADDFDIFRQSLPPFGKAGAGRKYTLLLSRVESAGPTTQQAIAEFIRSSSHTIIVTTRGRLLDHAKNGSINTALYNVLSPLPVWLAPLRERSDAGDLMSQHFLAQANMCFGFGTQKLQCGTHFDQIHRFPDNLAGLKRAVFGAVANQSLPIIPAPITPAASVVSKKSEDNVVNAQSNYAMVPLLDQNGKLRTLKDLEQDALLFAYTHQNARVGQIAKALKLGRTTLYRKLLEIGLVGRATEKGIEQYENIVQAEQRNSQSTEHKPEKYAA